MKVTDRRTEENWASHNQLVTAHDKCMSGWGGARGGRSIAAWACKPEHAQKVLEWVKARPEMRRVDIKPADYRPTNAAHFSVYVVDENHPALRES